MSPFAAFEAAVIGLSRIGRADRSTIVVLINAFAPMGGDDWNASGLEDHDGRGVKEVTVRAYGASLPRVGSGPTDEYLELVDVTFTVIVQQHGWQARYE